MADLYSPLRREAARQARAFEQSIQPLLAGVGSDQLVCFNALESIRDEEQLCLSLPRKLPERIGNGLGRYPELDRFAELPVIRHSRLADRRHGRGDEQE
ncbi:MAG TPA: hypothetical protein VKZ85_11120 [Woeseiaceae bacterium]|nr:hypothetical protein [Woeseiaceae bacterium]